MGACIGQKIYAVLTWTVTRPETGNVIVEVYGLRIGCLNAYDESEHVQLARGLQQVAIRVNIAQGVDRRPLDKFLNDPNCCNIESFQSGRKVRSEQIDYNGLVRLWPRVKILTDPNPRTDWHFQHTGSGEHRQSDYHIYGTPWPKPMLPSPLLDMLIWPFTEWEVIGGDNGVYLVRDRSVVSDQNCVCHYVLC